ncbi:ras association domain-containing protein 8 [Daktulosphaira vitifoliae]|uniref:ras association domain-containing protein 8 n=1 Tax=Daktulosphaira vitifoliae TaxID=58002 RepID=UPI0021A9FBC0|nr:ras association domain-containing protein 8 [Daktulosphaira vitifoliae]
MELKVWVEGIQRVVCGVTETTTCQDVVYALAHATGKTGRFTLIERWRNNERLLAPQDHPVTVLMKWGEYANDVQFILQRSGNVSSNNTANNPKISESEGVPYFSQERIKDTRKSLIFSNISNRLPDNVGVVRGIPQQKTNVLSTSGTNSALTVISSSSTIGVLSTLPISTSSQLNKDQISTSVNNSVLQPSGSPNKKFENSSFRPPIARALPPYREPPPPSVSPARISPTTVCSDRLKQPIFKEYQNENNSNSPNIMYNPQYKDLIRLINYQRDKLSIQQTELTKYDAEIMYWEGKTKEQQHQMDFMSQEAARIETTGRHTEEQLRLLGQVEEENDIARQQEKTLKSEMTLLRSKLANCETELLVCKNKIRLLMEEVETEKKMLTKDLEEKRRAERGIIKEVDRLQTEVERAKQETEMAAQVGDGLRKEVANLETTISEKKRQVEKLVSDMKEANLQSLAISPPEELKFILEGAQRPGSTRKMIGSPRQLENAAPTSKNPHGVWV